MKLRVKKLHPDARIPELATEGAAGFDLHAVIEGAAKRVQGGLPLVIRTGLAFEIPPGYAMLILSRSGHGFKADTRLANCVGLIDSDYRGEVQVKLTRDPSVADPITVHHGDRIAQAVIVAVPSVEFEETDALSSTVRGAGGFGSTGR
jgi:dUTP pyrophosphatase